MQSRMINFKNHLQFLSLDEQISKINFAIDKMHNSTNMHIPGDNIDIKFTTIKELKTLRRKIISNNKEIITLLCILFVLINSMSLNSGQ